MKHSFFLLSSLRVYLHICSLIFLFSRKASLTRKMSTFWTAVILFVIAAMHNQISVTEAIDIGVCYGMNGNDLPSPTDVIGLYKKYGIGKIRLFEPIPAVLDALKGKQIDVTLGVRNEDTPNLAASPDAALTWFTTYVDPYISDTTFQYIVVGNEMVPGQYSQYIEPTMRNFQKILDDRNLAGVKVTTVVHVGGVLGTSYPPSSGAFSNEARPTMTSILQFLAEHGSPLMINAYPYFAHAHDPANVPLEYALFTASSPVVVDGNLSYMNLLDAMVDSFLSAMERENVNNVEVVVSESGWPSAGNGDFTTPQLAATYNQNFIAHVIKNGTPKRPNAYIEGFLFAMFEENLKPAGEEQHFGLFYPNMQPVYPVFAPLFDD